MEVYQNIPILYITAENIITPMIVITFKNIISKLVSFLDLFYGILIYNLLVFIVLDRERNKRKEQEKRIEKLEKEILRFKQIERMREEFDHCIVRDFKMYYHYTDKKLLAIQNQIKQLKNEK
jgi:hypothetical protein